MDGEALPQEVNAQDLLAWAMHDADARLMWQHWHESGDAIRAVSGAHGRGGDAAQSRAAVGSAAWLSALQTRLADTPVAATPWLGHGVAGSTPSPAASTSNMPTLAKAANDSVFAWKMAAGFASFAAVGMLAWNMLAPAWTSYSGTSQPHVATVQTLAEPQSAPMQPSANTATTMASSTDNTMHMLLQAHAQLGEQTLLQETVQGADSDYF